MTHAAMDDEARARAGITPELLRLSVGLEDVRDLLDDLEQALSGRDPVLHRFAEEFRGDRPPAPPEIA